MGLGLVLPSLSEGIAIELDSTDLLRLLEIYSSVTCVHSVVFHIRPLLEIRVITIAFLLVTASATILVTAFVACRIVAVTVSDSPPPQPDHCNLPHHHRPPLRDFPPWHEPHESLSTVG